MNPVVEIDVGDPASKGEADEDVIPVARDEEDDPKSTPEGIDSAEEADEPEHGDGALGEGNTEREDEAEDEDGAPEEDN